MIQICYSSCALHQYKIHILYAFSHVFFITLLSLLLASETYAMVGLHKRKVPSNSAYESAMDGNDARQNDSCW
ncbi:hypothetical protein VNO77_39894 [Canavalia gladiata]|uniref:Uncharacterized protein n=1 Tax=Canavalia gladiata TaxID=3824 RepID=A0AAN9PPB8_CANGL